MRLKAFHPGNKILLDFLHCRVAVEQSGRKVVANRLQTDLFREAANLGSGGPMFDESPCGLLVGTGFGNTQDPEIAHNGLTLFSGRRVGHIPFKVWRIGV